MTDRHLRPAQYSINLKLYKLQRSFGGGRQLFQYSINLKLYKLQRKSAFTSALAEYSINLKLYKLQLGELRIRVYD